MAFSVEREYLRRGELFGVPVVPFEELPERCAPGEHEFYAALVYTPGQCLRTRLYESAKEMGYRPASYVSPRAFVWRNVKLGEHCFIFENNVIQPFVTIGDRCTVGAGALVLGDVGDDETVVGIWKKRQPAVLE